MHCSLIVHGFHNGKWFILSQWEMVHTINIMFSTIKSYLNENIRPINKQQNESEHPLESKQTDKNLIKIRK